MAKKFGHEVVYYYDSHPTEDDLRGVPSAHSQLVHYLMDVLMWQFRGQRCAVHKNLNFYHTPDPNEYPMDPDIAVIKGVERRPVRSWRVGKTGPAPQVVLEIGQEETWKRDLEEGPIRCAQMGVKEYFAYDPNEPPLSRNAVRRLFGWQLEKDSGDMSEMPLRADGSLWSQHLESFLVPDGDYLRLYDSIGHRRLTEVEDKTEVRHAAERRAEALAEKLRSLGVDPDQL